MLAEFVEFISAGNLILMLIFTAGISLILGMGLPTTANYIVVSSLMAPVIVSVGASNGLIVPLIAVHLFAFYFGILADDTWQMTRRQLGWRPMRRRRFPVAIRSRPASRGSSTTFVPASFHSCSSSIRNFGSCAAKAARHSVCCRHSVCSVFLNE